MSQNSTLPVPSNQGMMKEYLSNLKEFKVESSTDIINTFAFKQRTDRNDEIAQCIVDGVRFAMKEDLMNVPVFKVVFPIESQMSVHDMEKEQTFQTNEACFSIHRGKFNFSLGKVLDYYKLTEQYELCREVTELLNED